MADLYYESLPLTVQNLINMQKNRALNLSPGFQRDSVWTEADRRKLIDSIVRGYPLPSIFLYKRESDGRIIYDVIDGKQRIESILMFTGTIRGRRFSAKLQLPGDEEVGWLDWKTLCKQKRQFLIMGYKLQTMEVRGDPSDIIDLFVRINSTGKALTSAEKRHARYYKNSEFLRAAGRVARDFEGKLLKHKILSRGQISRMKHIEVICELMLSIHQNDVINKKAALDRVMESKSLGHNQIMKARAKTVRAINRVFKMFPNIRTTRFRQISDFYTLVFLIAQFEAENLILSDRRRNRLAADLLTSFSTNVDNVSQRQKRAKGIKPGQELYRDYYLTVLRGTDEVLNRRGRAEILRGLLQTLFKRKDRERLFSVEQRRILWNSAAEKKCQTCGISLTWEDFTIDHIDPHSKGGPTRLENAALMCWEHNSSKGAKRAAA